MEPELEHRLHSATKEQLLLLLQELVAIHPHLYKDIFTKIDALLQDEKVNMGSESSSADDWDFNEDALIPLYDIPPSSAQLPLDLETIRQRLIEYDARLQQGENLPTISNDLLDLLQEAEELANQHNYHDALDLYALVLDFSLLEHKHELITLFDQAIDDALPTLETVLNEASSSITFSTTEQYAPLLAPAIRQRWLQRLFTLWLQRLDRQPTETELPDMLLNIAWDEDIVLLCNLVRQALLPLRQDTSAQIVDFSRQYRVKMLEKFLKDLS